VRKSRNGDEVIVTLTAQSPDKEGEEKEKHKEKGKKRKEKEKKHERKNSHSRRSKHVVPDSPCSQCGTMSPCSTASGCSCGAFSPDRRARISDDESYSSDDRGIDIDYHETADKLAVKIKARLGINDDYSSGSDTEGGGLEEGLRRGNARRRHREGDRRRE
jgi:hypothetical protein